MVKVTFLYDQPTDAAWFEKYHNETHVPKYGLKIPNVIKADLNKARWRVTAVLPDCRPLV